MTWLELKPLYEQRIAHLIERSQKELWQSFNVLEEIVKQHYPEVIDNAFLILEHEFRERAQLTGRVIEVYKTLRILRKLLTDVHKIELLETMADAESKPYDKTEVQYCVTQWLIKLGWQNIEAFRTSLSVLDIFAQKDNLQFYGASLKSLHDIKTKWSHDIRGRYQEEFLNYAAFRKRLGSATLALIEKLNENKNTHAAVFIAGDTPTLEFAKQYITHLKKTGIKIYAVKSLREIIEL